MKFEIKSWLNGGVLFSAETESLKLAVELAVKSGANLAGANLAGANLDGANLAGANLDRANLYGASLTGANLYGANLDRANLDRANLDGASLTGANLYRANLYGANLDRANLYRANLYGANLDRANLDRANLDGAENLNKYLTSPLYLLFDQPGKIRAYKLVKENGEGPFNGGIIYKVGKSYIAEDADENEQHQCAKGINLATLDWCIKNWEPNRRILIAEFTAKDIAAIPIGSNGKFRVRKCKIVGEKNLKEMGIKGEK